MIDPEKQAQIDAAMRQADDHHSASKIDRLDRQLDEAREPRIEAAAAQCIAECDASSTPFTCVSGWIERLKADPGWSADDIIQFQMRVIRELMERARTK